MTHTSLTMPVNTKLFITLVKEEGGAWWCRVCVCWCSGGYAGSGGDGGDGETRCGGGDAAL